MEKRNFVPMVVSAKLLTLITEEYNSSGMSDEAFARYATVKLGYPINDIHITHRRRLLDVKGNYTLRQEQAEAKRKAKADAKGAKADAKAAKAAAAAAKNPKQQPKDCEALFELLRALEKRVDVLEQARTVRDLGTDD